MNHLFPLPHGGELSLRRYPRSAQHGLQAWEAADEYLLSEIATRSWDIDAPLLILNDAFGALTLALQAYAPISISDSRISQLALIANAQDNQLTLNGQSLTSLDAWPEQTPGAVLMKLPRTNALLEYQLAYLSQIMGPKTCFIAAAKAKDIHKSTLQLFERYIGETKTSLAKKKARLIFCQRDNKIPASPLPSPLAWSLDNTELTIYNYANVFSRAKLDIGARFLLEHLPCQRTGHIIDLGCGNGVLGLMAMVNNPDTTLTFVDESYMAIASAQHTVQKNLPSEAERAHFMVNNCLDEMPTNTADLILCNPPFHQQQAVTDHIAWQMFVDAKRVLNPSGELWVVANRHLDYHIKLKRLFGNQTVVAANHKFVILKAIKTS
ncbi:methyltransferase [Oceanisphaera pacifica]|uniref:Ribosomal RNA large subunit methyltransferase G n=1 Tax=Oceanisphaera pacifica TaxID=2818389 RepID=A0ABS3ND05_9GAMM|nr:methyltransferase [Oceanisphaera pacifica]MBO1518456.1 methyltransferase [Oceanisphaera pacifica]